MRACAVPPLDGSGLTVAIALPPSGVRFVLRTLGRSGGPGVPRKWKCRVESSGGTGHQGVAGPAFAPGTLVPLSTAAGGTGGASGDEAQFAGPGDGLGAVGRAGLAQDMADMFLDGVESDHEERLLPGGGGVPGRGATVRAAADRAPRPYRGPPPDPRGGDPATGSTSW